MIAFCQDTRRRELVLATPGLNGIDYVEVLGPAGCGRVLAVTFLKDATALALTPDNVALSGDAAVGVVSVSQGGDDPLTLNITLDGTGNFSPYTLALVANAPNPDPPAGIDPQLANVTFSFKAGCPTPADCLDNSCCPAPVIAAPDIHYLARDYDGFRQAMLDRMAVLVPDWAEQHAADPGITLVEVLAYAADRVTYLQDAVNTEAYLGTARSRISLRRHARLVDYRVQEGANARSWVVITAAIEGFVIPKGTQVFPLVQGLLPAVDPQSFAASKLTESAGPVFESIEALTLHPEQNEMHFYTWGDTRCCLPPGTTQATLDGQFPTLAAGNVLIFEELVGPATGDAADRRPDASLGSAAHSLRLSSAWTGGSH